MLYAPLELGQLRDTLPQLVSDVHAALSDTDKHFLLALKRGIQDWHTFALPEAEHLPAIRWKVMNLARMNPAKRREAAAKLEKVLFG